VKWISKIVRNADGALRVEVEGISDTPVFCRLSEVSPGAALQGVARKRIDIALHLLRPLGPGEVRTLLSPLNLPFSSQTIYEHICAEGHFLIPSQALIFATVGRCKQYRDVLLQPNGPSALMTSFIGDRRLQVLPTPNRMLRNKLTLFSVARRLEWIITYPSATRAWGSVYQNALAGRFDMALPKAEVTAKVTALSIGRILFVTRLELMSLQPTELPHPFARGRAKSSFVFNETTNFRPAHRKSHAPKADHRLATFATGQRISEIQWATVEPLLICFYHPSGNRRKGKPRAYPLRDIIDLILLKLAAPYPWSKVPGNERVVQRAKRIFDQLKNQPIWEEIVAVLSDGEYPKA